MEAEVITSFLPQLVTAVSDCVQSVSDQCLAKGLIPDAVYKRVLESGAASEDKARTLVLAVKKSTETDKRCFELFMNILEQELPYTVRDGLLEKIRREANEKASSCTAVVPSNGDLRQIPRGELSRESVVQQTHLLGRLEEAVRQHQRACDEKKLTKQKLKAKTEECNELKHALEAKMQYLSVLDKAKDKISTCESEIKRLTKRVKELENIVEEQAMQVKRGRNNAVIKTKEMFTRIAQESHTAGWEKGIEDMEDREYESTTQGKGTKKNKLEDEVEQQEDPETPVDYHIPMYALKREHAKIISSSITKSIHLYYPDEKDAVQCWTQFGLELGFSKQELRDLHSQDPARYVESIIENLLKQCPGDSRGSKRFPDYNFLKEALAHAGLGGIAVNDLPSLKELGF